MKKIIFAVLFLGVVSMSYADSTKEPYIKFELTKADISNDILLSNKAGNSQSQCINHCSFEVGYCNPYGNQQVLEQCIIDWADCMNACRQG